MIHGIQKLLNVCTNFADEYDILFNEKKSQCLCYQPSGLKLNPPQVAMNGKCIQDVQSAKYLGHQLSSDMSDNVNIQRQLRSVYARGNMLLRKFGKCSKEVKLYLFRTYCTSMYTCQLWCKYTQAQYKKLRVAYNNIFRRFMGYDPFYSAQGMFVENNIDSFEVLMRKNVYSFMTRMQCSTNKLVNNVMMGLSWEESQVQSNVEQKIILSQL